MARDDRKSKRVHPGWAERLCRALGPGVRIIWSVRIVRTKRHALRRRTKYLISREIECLPPMTETLASELEQVSCSNHVVLNESNRINHAALHVTGRAKMGDIIKWATVETVTARKDNLTHTGIELASEIMVHDHKRRIWSDAVLVSGRIDTVETNHQPICLQ